MNRAVPAAELAASASALTARLATRSAPALAPIKRDLTSAFETPFVRALDTEAAALLLSAATPEAAAALRAFFAKSDGTGKRGADVARRNSYRPGLDGWDLSRFTAGPIAT